MPQPQHLSSDVPFVAIQRPACPRCKAAMMLASIEPARPGVDLHTFECAICNHVLKSLAAYADPMKSKGLGRWLQGDLYSQPFIVALMTQLAVLVWAGFIGWGASSRTGDRLPRQVRRASAGSAVMTLSRHSRAFGAAG